MRATEPGHPDPGVGSTLWAVARRDLDEHLRRTVAAATRASEVIGACADELDRFVDNLPRTVSNGYKNQLIELAGRLHDAALSLGREVERSEPRRGILHAYGQAARFAVAGVHLGASLVTIQGGLVDRMLSEPEPPAVIVTVQQRVEAACEWVDGDNHVETTPTFVMGIVPNDDRIQFVTPGSIAHSGETPFGSLGVVLNPGLLPGTVLVSGAIVRPGGKPAQPDDVRPGVRVSYDDGFLGADEPRHLLEPWEQAQLSEGARIYVEWGSGELAYVGTIAKVPVVDDQSVPSP